MGLLEPLRGFAEEARRKGSVRQLAKLSVRDLDLKGKRVFVRVDFNVPLKDGRIGDDTRIQASLPTIQLALKQNATVVLASHLGRPKGKVNPQMSLRPIADRLADLLNLPVTFTEDCVGGDAVRAIEGVKTSGGGVVLLENLRFHAEEEKNDPEFAKALTSLCDEYVNDAFGAAHRAHASVEAITHYVKRAAAGLLMERELKYLGHALESPERPFVAILGGAKVSDKIEVIQNMLGRVNRLIIGGAMAYTFFKSRGVPIGRSLVEDDKLDAAKAIEADAAKRGVALLLPVDHVVTDRIEPGTANEVLAVTDARIGNRLGVDIGPHTIKAYEAAIADAKTVVWNGPMGVFEIEAFAIGTNAVARAVASVKGTTIVGGGDSIAAVKKSGMADRITHISTGGGASLEFLGGRALPGVVALTEKG
jgi:phosphoglycerate kinase